MANDENANVVLTADTSGYSQGIQAATVQTNQLIAAVDSLSGKLSNLTKNVGRKLVLFSAADTAAMAGMLKLASNFEDQLQTLNAQLKVSGGSIETYRQGINKLAGDLPVARSELAGLATQLKMSGVESQKASETMSRTFVMLARTTGTSIADISQGMVDLSRQMGTLGSGGDAMAKFADSLTTVAAKSGVSATNVLSFANAIAPASRMAGIGQREVMGLATAFSKAGADGYAAANTFNGMLNDITRSVNNGSPDLAKYANLIGITVDQFRSMDKTQAITKIFETINSQGPKAIDTLDRMGIDGVKAVRSIQAVAQAGDIRSSVASAFNSYGNGSTASAFNGTNSLSDEMKRIGNAVQILGTNIGEVLLPPATAVAGAFANVLSSVVALTVPLQHLAGLVGAVAAPVAAAGGVALQSMGMLSTAAMVAYAARGRGVRAFTGGFKAGQEGRGFGGGMGWANPIGRFAAGMGAYMPAEPGVSGLSRVAALPFRAASMFMRGSTQLYLDSMRNGEDRPNLFSNRSEEEGGGTGAGRGRTAFGLSRAFGNSYKVAMQDAAAAALAGAKAQIGLAEAAKLAAGDLVKLGVATTRAGISGIGMGLRGAGGMAMRGLGGIASGLGPLGLGLLGVEAAGWIKQNNQDRNQTTDTAYNPLTAYNAALGIATDSARNFGEALDKNSQILYKSVSQAFAVNSSTVSNATAKPYTNPMFENLSSPDQAISLIRTMNVKNPQAAGLVAQDIVKRFGAQVGQQILSASQGNGGNGTGDIASMAQGATQTQMKQGFVDWVKTGGGVSQDAGDQLDATVGAIAQKTEEVRAKNGDKAAEQTKVALLQTLWNNIPNGPEGQGMRAKLVKLFEQKQVLGTSDMGYNGSQDWSMSWSDLLQLASQSPGGASMLKSWANQGLDTGSGAGAAATKLTSGAPLSSAIDRTKAGGFAAGNSRVQAALASPEDQTANRIGAFTLLKGMGGTPALGGNADAMNKSFSSATASLEQLKAAITDTSNPLHALAVAAQSAMGVLTQMAAMGQSRGQRWSGAYSRNMATINTPNVSETDRNAAVTGVLGTAQEVDSYYSSMILAFRQYQRQMTRAEEDYNLQTSRMAQDYYTGRRRQQEDFTISMKRQAEDAAKSIYDPFKRVYSTYTESAASVLENLGDQNKRIQDQRRQLAQLRKMGVSQSAIDTLDLSNPANAQQVARMVGDLASNPGLIKQINAAITTRMKGAKELVQSPFSQSYRRAIEDFNRGIARGEQDFSRGLSRMAADNHKMQKRAAQDMALFGEEALGTIASKQQEALRLITKNLGGLGAKLRAEIEKQRAQMPWLFDAKMLEKIFGASPSDHPRGYPAHGITGPVASDVTPSAATPSAAPGAWLAPTNPFAKSTPKTYSSRTSIDHSTNWAINTLNVQAPDPAKLAKQLADQARVRKLARAGVY